MPGTIGGRDCLSVVTNLTRPHHTLRRDARPAAHGAAYRQQGKRPKPASIVSIIDLETPALCREEFALYQAMVASDPITVVDNHGTQYDLVQVVDVGLIPLGQQHVGVEKVECAVGGLNAAPYLLHCRWSVESTDLT